MKYDDAVPHSRNSANGVSVCVECDFQFNYARARVDGHSTVLLDSHTHKYHHVYMYINQVHCTELITQIESDCIIKHILRFSQCV